MNNSRIEAIKFSEHSLEKLKTLTIDARRDFLKSFNQDRILKKLEDYKENKQNIKIVLGYFYFLGILENKECLILDIGIANKKDGEGGYTNHGLLEIN